MSINNSNNKGMTWLSSQVGLSDGFYLTNCYNKHLLFYINVSGSMLWIFNWLNMMSGWNEDTPESIILIPRDLAII